MDASARFDDLFLRVAGAAGGIEPLLDAFFSFLSRKTDFYVVHGDDNASYAAGFPPGQAERMVLAAFRRYPMKPLKDTQLERGERPACKQRVKEPSPGPLVRYTKEGKQVPLGNGGIAATHTWTQTLAEATAYFELPAGTRAKDVQCSISGTKLEIVIPQADQIVGAFYDRVVEDGSMWTLDRDKTGRASLVVTLEKTRHTWWASIFKDADAKECIDTTKVDSTKKMDEYDELTQATIRKIMFDQRQKARGLPTSDEMKTNELLEKVRNIPGSPFLETSSSD